MSSTIRKWLVIMLVGMVATFWVGVAAYQLGLSEHWQAPLGLATFALVIFGIDKHWTRMAKGEPTK